MDIDSKFTLNNYEKGLVRKAGRSAHYRKGQTIFVPGDHARQVFLIERGWVTVYFLTADGRRVTVAIRRPGELAGIAEALCNVGRPFYAEAMEKTDMIIIEKEKFVKLFQTDPRFALSVAEVLGGRLRAAQSAIFEMVSWPVHGRLALFLLKLAERFGVDTGNGVEINLKLTHEEIACLIGTSRPTVTPIFSAFKKEKTIIMEGRHIKIVYPEKLKKWIQ